MKSAWVIQCEVNSRQTKLVCLIDSRRGHEYIMDLLEVQLHIQTTTCWKEIAQFAQSKENRYKAKLIKNNTGFIQCGIGSPCLFATKVKDVIIGVDERGRQTIEYTIPPLQKLDENSRIVDITMTRTVKYFKAENGDLVMQ